MQRAYDWARTELIRKYHIQYEKFYEEEKRICINKSRAQAKSRTRLVRMYKEEYKSLCRLAVRNGHPVINKKEEVHG